MSIRLYVAKYASAGMRVTNSIRLWDTLARAKRLRTRWRCEPSPVWRISRESGSRERIRAQVSSVGIVTLLKALRQLKVRCPRNWGGGGTTRGAAGASGGAL